MKQKTAGVSQFPPVELKPGKKSKSVAQRSHAPQRNGRTAEKIRPDGLPNGLTGSAERPASLMPGVKNQPAEEPPISEPLKSGGSKAMNKKMSAAGKPNPQASSASLVKKSAAAVKTTKPTQGRNGPLQTTEMTNDRTKGTMNTEPDYILGSST